MKANQSIALLTMAIIFLVSAALAQEPAYQDIVEPAVQGSVNWTKGTISAGGIAFPPDNVTDPSRARVMTERAAFVVALRNLLEVVKGVRVDATTVVENFMLKSDTIQTQVSGFVRGAQTAGKKVNPDGSVEVIVVVPLWGDGALTGLLADTKKVGTQVIETAPSPGDYTELILDARGMGITPVVFPTIADESGNVIYAPDYVSREDALRSGMARYVTTKPEVRSQKFEDRSDSSSAQGGRKPLKIKAVGKDKKLSANLIISADDAKKVKASDKIADFLRRCRVTIIIDALISGTEGKLAPGYWSLVSEK
ncbi:MAG: hypothetical protein HZA13_08675 [Nitrospirae bacterium]|nr:hypothetical protein [Nitrospirota bacterium]